MSTYLDACRVWLRGASMLAASCGVGGAMGLWLLATTGGGQRGEAAGAGGGSGGTRAASPTGPTRMTGMAGMAGMVVLGIVGCLTAGLLYGLSWLWEGSSFVWGHVGKHVRDRHRRAALHHA